MGRNSNTMNGILFRHHFMLLSCHSLSDRHLVSSSPTNLSNTGSVPSLWLAGVPTCWRMYLLDGYSSKWELVLVAKSSACHDSQIAESMLTGRVTRGGSRGGGSLGVRTLTPLPFGHPKTS